MTKLPEDPVFLVGNRDMTQTEKSLYDRRVIFHRLAPTNRSKCGSIKGSRPHVSGAIILYHPEDWWPCGRCFPKLWKRWLE